LNGKKLLLTVAIAFGMLLIVSVGAIAPDSPSDRSDNSRNVGVNVVNPRINNCSIWNTGPNGVVNLWPRGDDLNLTNRQIDVNTQPALNITYFLVNVSLFGGGGLTDISSVNVTAWFDNNSETDRSMTWPRQYPNRNLTINYSYVTGAENLLYPTSGEVTAETFHIGFTNATTQEVGLGFRWGPNIRWATGPGAWTTTAGWNDLKSWNFACRVTLKAGGDPTDWEETWHKMEFGTYKYTALSVSGNPTATQPPGSGWRGFLGSPDQQVTYNSNAPFNLTANISDLKRTGGGANLPSKNLGITGENLKTMGTFWTGSSNGNGKIFIAGANGTGYSSFVYINSGNGNLTGTGPTYIEWYVSVPVGTQEGTYTALIDWLLSTSLNATP